MKNINFKFILFIALAFLIFQAGCDKGVEKVVQNPPPHKAAEGTGMPSSDVSAPSHTKPPSRKVVVPPFVEGKWSAVKFSIKDKKTGSTTSLTVPIGGSKKFGDDALTVEVINFLPNFFIQDDIITSVDNQAKNPAVKIRVTEGDKVLMESWIFSKMPEIHAFTHDQWGLFLVEGIPAGDTGNSSKN